jgi:acetylglutamate kinase
MAPAAKAAILVEALPYIRSFWGKVVVIKYGGSALAGATAAAAGNDATLASFATDIVLMRSVGMRPLVVHGGGPQIGELMARLGKVPEFIDGLRVTDADTLDIARMVLGKVNRDIVAAINVHAPLAVGVSGEDAGLISAQARDPQLGFVGDVAAVNPDLLVRLLAEDLIPVVATIGSDPTGQAYNINADTAAGAIASAVGAAKLVYLTDVDGIRRDRHDPTTRVSAATAGELEMLLGDGTIDGGMIPKARSCLRAVNDGVAQAHILDGRGAHALLLEIFTHQGVGTMVTADGDGT